MSYGTSPTKWKVLTKDPQGNALFDLDEDDILEFTGTTDGSRVVKRHREGVATIDWGIKCSYTATPSPKVTGTHNASGTDTFELKIAASSALVEHRGDINHGSGTGGNGTWTAEEGG